MKAVTLKHVAAAAGVSVSTASRVLDDRLPASPSQTARRVREAAEELGYHKDPAASALRRGDSSAVGVLVPRLTDTVMALLFEAIYTEAAARGLFAMVSVCGDDAAQEQSAVDSLLARRVDGIVLAAARLDDPLPERLRARHVPHVLALRTDDVSPSAVCDDELGGYLATRHLLDRGHTRIAVLPGPPFTSTAARRLAGYRRAMSEANLDVDDGDVRPSSFSTKAGYEAAGALLDERPGTTAVFAANDQLAVGLLHAAADRGIEVPADLSVVGYNDTPIARQLSVPLTSVRVPFDRIGSDAIALLIAQIHTSRTMTIATEFMGARRVSTPTLIPRGSTALHS